MHSSFPLRLVAAVLLAFPALALAQGALTPPTGTPTPSMKSLDQLEPRTPLVAGSPGVNVNANGGFTIIESGSYYLTHNLSVATGSGIILAADNISLDLSGFTISSTSTEAPVISAYGYTGVLVEYGRRGITIANGHIWSGSTFSGTTLTPRGFAYGVYACSTGTTSVHIIHISDLTVTGVAYTGIEASGCVDLCNVSIADTGIYASAVSNSTAEECVAFGIRATCATNCTGSISSPRGIGLYSITAVGCKGFATADAVDATGLMVFNGVNCTGTVMGDGGCGLVADSATSCQGLAQTTGNGLGATTALGCYGWTNNGAKALYAVIAENSYGHCPGSGTGLDADSAVNCSGVTISGIGLSAINATNCDGRADGGTALKATNIANSHGKTTGTGVGIDGVTVAGSYGESVNNTGLRADASAENCRGVATGTGYGLYSGGIATGCTGMTATGNYGVYVVGTATACRGDNNATTGTKAAIHAGIAVACTAETGSIEAGNRYNMPASP